MTSGKLSAKPAPSIKVYHLNHSNVLQGWAASAVAQTEQVHYLKRLKHPPE